MRNILLAGVSTGIGNKVFKLMEHTYNMTTISRSDMPDSKRHYQIDLLNDELPELTDPFDGLVYFPGSIFLRPFHQIKDETFIEDFEINVMVAIRVIRKYLNNLKAGKQSSVVLFSTVAVQQGMPFHASIAASKGAIEGLTRSLAAEFAPVIRFNAVAPSLTDTPLACKLLRTDKQREASAEKHPMKRIGNTGDIADTVEFLLSEKSSWITGQILHVDGGMSSLKI